MIHQDYLKTKKLIKFEKHLDLDLISDKASLANAFTNEKPTSNLSHHDCVDSNFLHGGLSPFEGKSILGESSDTLDSYNKISRSRGSQLNPDVSAECGQILEDKPLPSLGRLHQSHGYLL